MNTTTQNKITISSRIPTHIVDTIDTIAKEASV